MQQHMPSTLSWPLCRCGHQDDTLLNNVRVLSVLLSPDGCPLPYACSWKEVKISAKVLAGLRVTAAAEIVCVSSVGPCQAKGGGACP